jgi:pilus assembly protein FimV
VLPGRAANAVPETPPAATDEALRNAQKVQQLEGDVKALRDSAVKNEATLTDLKTRLQKAEAERFPAALVYGLAALLLASVLAAVFLWLRQRRALPGAHDWWNPSGANAAPVAVIAGVPGPIDGLELQAQVRTAESAPDTAASPVSVRDSVFAELMGGSAIDAVVPDALAKTTSAAAARPVRRLGSDAVWALRRRAQQLVSLRNSDQALQILKQQIRDSKEPNPFVYLDLLGLLHSLRLQAEFKKYCQDFKLLFNADVPEFSLYREQGKGLESYPEVLSTITGLWPKPEVQVFIEACIFRDPWNDRSQPFDLAAFRDLLILQVIAQSESEAAPAFPELSSSALAELSARSPAPAPALDLNLSDMDAAAQAPPRAHIDLTRLIPGDHEQVLTSMAELGGGKSTR